MLDEYDHSRIADDIYFALDPHGEHYDFMGKDVKLSLKYILSHIPAEIEFEEKKFSRMKRVVGALVIRGRLSEIMSDANQEFGCDFYFEDISIDIDMDSFHIDISRIIVEASKGTAQAQRGGNC
jgi:hypothetical protein